MAGLEIQHTETSGVDNATLQTHVSRLSAYRDELKTVVRDGSYNSPESTLVLPSDEVLGEKIDEVTESFFAEDSLSDVIVIGMGGSARGSRAVYDLLVDETTARLHTIETISESVITEVVTSVLENCDNPRKLAICVVSKSGKTTETIANTNLLLAKLGEVFGLDAVKNQVVAITQPGSQLQKLARGEGMKTIEVPEQVSGRFSVFSAAGLLPLALSGINVEEIRSGATALREVCLFGRPSGDPAAALAAILYTQIQASTRILNHFFFTSRARSLGRWNEQLFAESLGKRKNKRGEPTFSGVYPITSIGPDDLHASFQLQLGGPKNFLTFFVRQRDISGDLTLPINDSGLLPESMSYLNNHTLGDVHQALTKATIESFREDGRPFVDISIPKFTAQRVGQLIFLEELLVMYVGWLLEINAFNQPQINEYKTRMTELLDN